MKIAVFHNICFTENCKQNKQWCNWIKNDILDIAKNFGCEEILSNVTLVNEVFEWFNVLKQLQYCFNWEK